MVPRLKDLLPLIHKRLEEMDKNQDEIGDLLRVDQSGMSRRLSGKTRFKLEELEVLLPYLGIASEEELQAHFVSFPRLSMMMHNLAPSSHKNVAMVLRAMADDLDAAAIG